MLKRYDIAPEAPVKMVSPLLHHLVTGLEVQGMVIGCGDAIALLMCELSLNMHVIKALLMQDC